MLLAVLEEARNLGFLGPGDVRAHIEHARSFLDGEDLAGAGLDLGSGGGVPGLVLAAAHPGSTWVLLEPGRRRSSFLASAIASLGLAGRVVVRRQAAEPAGHDPVLRGAFQVVTSRSFGPPARTAECASPFLVADGRLLVAEPPSDGPGRRWPPDGLAALGLTDLGLTTGSSRVRVLVKRGVCPDGYPRPLAAQRHDPLW